jgi:hypothetical protein
MLNLYRAPRHVAKSGLRGYHTRRHDRRVWEATDPDGRRVVLSAERWLHVLEGHEELAGELDAILEALATPALRRHGRWPPVKSGSTWPDPDRPAS